MKISRLLLLALPLFISSCTQNNSHHPWVEPGMSRSEVLDIMGQPIRTDSIHHQHELDRGSLSWETLDSIRRTLPAEEGNRMLLGHFVDRTAPSDQYVTWYYGPVLTDTSFTLERSPTGLDSIEKVWYSIRKQRAVLFDAKTMVVKERGFAVLGVTRL